MPDEFQLFPILLKVIQCSSFAQIKAPCPQAEKTPLLEAFCSAFVAAYECRIEEERSENTIPEVCFFLPSLVAFSAHAFPDLSVRGNMPPMGLQELKCFILNRLLPIQHKAPLTLLLALANQQSLLLIVRSQPPASRQWPIACRGCAGGGQSEVDSAISLTADQKETRFFKLKDGAGRRSKRRIYAMQHILCSVFPYTPVQLALDFLLCSTNFEFKQSAKWGHSSMNLESLLHS